MNTLLNNLRSTTCVINNLLKNGNLCVTRGFKSDLKIKWIRPEKIPSTFPQKSGDGGIDLKVTDNDLMMGYEKSSELQSADEIVKKMFTLEFQHIQETVVKKREMTIDLVKGHEYDRLSQESILAHMTNEILYLQQYMTQHPRNKTTKTFLKELIDKRKKFLNKLRTQDYKKFEWLLEKLNLTFKPHCWENMRIERKASLRKLTAKHCDKIRQDKLDAYRAELDNEKKIFFKEKLEQLKFIRSEQIACGVTPTVSEDDIVAASEEAAKYQ